MCSSDLAEKLAAAGGLRVTSRPELVRDLAHLLRDDQARAEMAAAGRAVIAREQGATARHEAVIRRFLVQGGVAHGTLHASTAHA